MLIPYASRIFFSRNISFLLENTHKKSSKLLEYLNANVRPYSLLLYIKEWCVVIYNTSLTWFAETHYYRYQHTGEHTILPWRLQAELFVLRVYMYVSQSTSKPMRDEYSQYPKTVVKRIVILKYFHWSPKTAYQIEIRSEWIHEFYHIIMG